MPLYYPPSFTTFARSTTQVARNSVNAAGDATETELVTVALPKIGPNGIVRVDAVFSGNNNASTKIYRIRLGGIGGTMYYNHSGTTAALSSRAMFLICANDGSESSQIGQAASTQFATTSGAHVTSSVTWTSSADLTFSCAWGAAVSGETIALERYLIEVCY